MGCFTMGPLAGVAIELVKILLNLVINGTATAGVGELANFLIGCALVLPAAIIYKRMHTRKGAIIGMATGTIFMTVVAVSSTPSFCSPHTRWPLACQSRVWWRWELL